MMSDDIPFVGLLIIKTDVDKWRKKYNLPVIETSCELCGEFFKLDIPIATKLYRGLMTKSHACGEEFRDIVAVHKNDKNGQNILYL